VTIATGTRLGPYELLAPLGAGGMGEVYRARDTKLNRDVAIKVLPDLFAADPDRLARFQREAQVLAALNHPNIAQIYGLEETSSAGVAALVMELVDGEDLAQRLARGPLPLEEAVSIGAQVADALEAAHEQGIIHRDLKPANVKVRPDGTVKVLDFGLAKAMDPAAAAGASATMSPTLTARATQLGTIIGTAAYMAPEQARGKPVDKRADIWAFGCVLYEMLTGQQAFAGDTVSDMLAAVVQREPDWNALPAYTPPRLHDLLRRSLQKNPKERLRDIGDARIELDSVRVSPAGSTERPARTWRRFSIPLGLALAGGVIAFAVASVARRPVSQPIQAITHLALPTPSGTRLNLAAAPGVAISPDGRRVAFVAASDGIRRIYLRDLGARDAQPLAGTEGGYYPFFAPDGQWLGFLAERRLKKIAVSGGAPVTLMNLGAGVFGLAWSEHGMIAFAPRFDGPLMQVSSDGGVPRELTALDNTLGDVGHHWPQWLPGGKAVMFTSIAGDASWDDATIVVQSLDTGQRKVLIKGGTYARYSPSGHLVYLHAGTIMAVPFDLDRLEVRGAPAPVMKDVLQSVIGAGHFDVATTGDLAYVGSGGSSAYMAASAASLPPALSWVDRNDRTQPLKIAQQPYLSPRVSPDGRRIAVWILAGARCAIGVFDVERESWTRLTFSGDNHSPVWTPDGQWVAYNVGTGGTYDIFIKRSDGSGTARQLTQSRPAAAPSAWTPDGRTLLYTDFQPDTGWDIWWLPMVDGPGSAPSGGPQAFLRTAANELMPVLAPDGRWIAYVSDESGRSEILVRSFPDAGGPWQVSPDGGSEPVWSRDGKELFYRRGERIMAVRVATTPTFSAAKPVALFEDVNDFSAETWGANFDTAPDGRLLMLGHGAAVSAPAHVSMVLNWVEELRQRVK
jgi:Tol biopolymer transport system component